jgi:hypothetical protein
MKSLADGLPPEIAPKIHPDWRKNEAAYWSMRDQLLSQYQGQWIAFADGAVIAACKTSLEVLHTPGVMGRHPFVICVGREDEPYRIRRATFAYDPTYPGQALPLLSAEFRSVSGSGGLVLDRVIPDTGADVSVLPWSDCQQLHLDPAVGVSGVMGGVGAAGAATIGFPAWVWLDGQEYPCQLQADFAGQERILGRDVLNRMDVLFRGPSGEVVLNP